MKYTVNGATFTDKAAALKYAAKQAQIHPAVYKVFLGTKFIKSFDGRNNEKV